VSFTHLCRRAPPQNLPQAPQLRNLRKDLPLVLNLNMLIVDFLPNHRMFGDDIDRSSRGGRMFVAGKKPISEPF
jgi:hypothetical protein